MRVIREVEETVNQGLIVRVTWIGNILRAHVIRLLQGRWCRWKGDDRGYGRSQLIELIDRDLIMRDRVVEAATVPIRLETAHTDLDSTPRDPISRLVTL